MLTRIVNGVEVICSASEEAEILATQAACSSSALKYQAQAALDKTTGPSGTIIRCMAAGVSVPPAWSAYVLALRLIANGSDTISTVLPPQPAYPAGT